MNFLTKITGIKTSPRGGARIPDTEEACQCRYIQRNYKLIYTKVNEILNEEK
jgi:hypothetical protein